MRKVVGSVVSFIKLKINVGKFFNEVWEFIIMLKIEVVWCILEGRDVGG